jgi:hypothetical protein
LLANPSQLANKLPATNKLDNASNLATDNYYKILAHKPVKVNYKTAQASISYKEDLAMLRPNNALLYVVENFKDHVTKTVKACKFHANLNQLMNKLLVTNK